MTKDETRKILSDDIDNFRAKAKYYESLHLFEAKKYADTPCLKHRTGTDDDALR